MRKKVKNLQGLVVLKSFLLTKRIASGSFGAIYQALNCQQSGVFYAVKAQSSRAEIPQVIFEFKLYKLLHKGEQPIGFPKIYGASIQKDHNFLVMQYLGRNLEELVISQGGKFTLKTVILVAIQTLDRLEFLHQRGFIHRDLKPENLVIGHGRKSKIIHLIDLGFCKRYFNIQRGHIPQNQEKRQIVGTFRFSSKNGTKGFQQSRKDDLESLCYILVYLLKGSVPWDSPEKYGNLSYEEMLMKKETTSTSLLCTGLPNQFKEFVESIQKLKFQQNPNYEGLKHILIGLANNKDIKLDQNFDWSPKLFDFLKQ